MIYQQTGNDSFAQPIFSIPSRFFAFAAVLFFWANAAGAMDFREAGQGGNCAGCWWIVAEGEITSTTHVEFAEFYEGLGGTAAVDIFLDSPGGNLFAGMALGRLIRETGLNTKIGISRRPKECKTLNDCPIWEEKIYAGSCASACAYAFLGGQHRMVAQSDYGQSSTTSSIGFHQFYGDLDKLTRLKNIIAEENYFSDEQFISASVLRYVTDMGVDPNVLGLAAGAGPSEMEYPNANTRKALKIDYNPDFGFSELDLEAYKGGLIGFSRPNYDNPFNELDQITFYCRNTSSLDILFTIPKHGYGNNRLLSNDYGVIRFNFDKGVEYHDYGNDDLVFSAERVKQWSDEENSYFSIILTEGEKQNVLQSSVIAFNLDVSRAAGNFKGYIKFNEKSVQSLKLISKICF